MTPASCYIGTMKIEHPGYQCKDCGFRGTIVDEEQDDKYQWWRVFLCQECGEEVFDAILLGDERDYDAEGKDLT